MINQERTRVLENNRRVLAFRGTLPMICYGDMEYYVDFRLQEMRPADEPHKVFPFLFLCDEQLKAQLRALRAEFSTPCFMEGLD